MFNKRYVKYIWNGLFYITFWTGGVVFACLLIWIFILYTNAEISWVAIASPNIPELFVM